MQEPCQGCGASIIIQPRLGTTTTIIVDVDTKRHKAVEQISSVHAYMEVASGGDSGRLLVSECSQRCRNTVGTRKDIIMEVGMVTDVYEDSLNL